MTSPRSTLDGQQLQQLDCAEKTQVLPDTKEPTRECGSVAGTDAEKEGTVAEKEAASKKPRLKKNKEKRSEIEKIKRDKKRETSELQQIKKEKQLDGAEKMVVVPDEELNNKKEKKRKTSELQKIKKEKQLDGHERVS